MNKCKKLLFLLASIAPSFVFAISHSRRDGVIGGFENADHYLKMAMYWEAVCALAAVTFLLFKSHQESVLNSYARAIGVIAFLSLTFTIPTWFGINCI